MAVALPRQCPADMAIPSGFVYLAAILDAWSRRVVGYAISRSVDARLTLTAVKAAIQVASPRSGVCGVCALGHLEKLTFSERAIWMEGRPAGFVARDRNGSAW